MILLKVPPSQASLNSCRVNNISPLSEVRNYGMCPCFLVVFEKMSVFQIVTRSGYKCDASIFCNQLNLFEKKRWDTNGIKNILLILLPEN